MEQAAFHFVLRGNPLMCTDFGHGNINYTFLVTTDAGYQYILQRINKHVFKNPDKLMQNVIAVSEHIRSKESGAHNSLHFVQTDEGTYYYTDEMNRFWRCYEFVGGLCLEAPESDMDFYESAVAFGRFQEQLADFPADTLHETIPNFHNTPERFKALHNAVEEDACDRVKNVQQELNYLFSKEEEAGTIQRLLEAGSIPLRVTHNDTKLNNVLLDPKTRKALCVLDLDTVMPGSSLFDFGDSVRFGAATAEEDTQELSQMELDLNLFEMYVKGYLNACHSLSKREVELLPEGAITITLELASRFMTDYLEGDHYFKTQYPDHNLVRARAQIKLAQDMDKKRYRMQEIVNKYIEG
ncbi:MAG: aminoglycoside phosphotransferase family protein [Oscillospiraceae bacterium]|nr:aminoglycoside phosphotransferase family protein [Oscillospiraceae bacterium]